MAGEIVHNDEVAGAKLGQHELDDVGFEPDAIGATMADRPPAWWFCGDHTPYGKPKRNRLLGRRL